MKKCCGRRLSKMNLNQQISLFNQVNYLDKLLFTKHLAVIIKSGIPLVEGIEVIKDQSNNRSLKALLTSVLKDINNGQTLGKALAKFPKIFDPLYLSLIKIGEESGNLEANLQYLSDQLRKSYEFKKKVQAALLYPGIVLLTAAIVGGGISFFVLPRLVDLFKSLDVNLPLSTKVLLFVSELFRKFGVFIFLGLVALIAVFRVSITLSSIKPKWHQFLLAIPVIGVFLQSVQLASFCRNLGIMLKSGLPIANGLQVEADACDNLVFKRYIQQLHDGILKGKSIEEEIESARFKYFPEIASKMIGIGERTGKLDESLIYLADFFEDEVDDSARNFSSVLEPLLLIAVGLVVAFLAFSIITPIYQFTGSIHR